MTEIGLDAGFATISQFHRAFAKAVGVSPEQFRGGSRVEPADDYPY